MAAVVNNNKMASSMDTDVTIAIAAVVSNCFLDDSQQYLESIGLLKRKRSDMMPLLLAAVAEQQEEDDDEKEETEKAKKRRRLAADDDDVDDGDEEEEEGVYEVDNTVPKSMDIRMKGINGLRSLSLCTDYDFKSQFRLSRSCVQRLMELLPPFVPCPTGRPSLIEKSPETMILLSLWTMGNQEPFKGIAERFNIGQGHAYKTFLYFCNRVNTLRETFIAWPKGADAGRVMREFSVQNEIGFPDVIGCIDGVSMSICGSKLHNPDKKTVFLECVCDANERFIDVFADVIESSSSQEVNDPREWYNTPLCDQIEMHQTMIPQGAHMLGDIAYPLTTYLMVPYADNGNLTQKQKLFNTALSSTHIVIQQAFHKLFSRFRRLKHLMMFRMDRTPLVLLTGCILHNLCVDAGDSVPEVEQQDNFLNDSWSFADNQTRHLDVSLARDAKLKREAIANRLLATQQTPIAIS